VGLSSALLIDAFLFREVPLVALALAGAFSLRLAL
jgi:hypothetical protein